MRALLDKWWLGWAAAVLLVVGSLAWYWWWSSQPEPPRARQYREETVCLLTDEKGVAGPQAAKVWAGMQEASLATLVKVQYLAIAGPQTVENGEPFVASLAQGGCQIVLAVGEVPVQALERSAPRFPQQRFVVVGASSASGANLAHVEGNAGTVRDLILEEFGSR